MFALLRRQGRRLLALLGVACLSTTLNAGDIRADRPDLSYTTLATLPQFDGVGRVNSFFPCSASYIGNGWFLTAAHLGAISNVTLGSGPSAITYNVIPGQNFVAPGWVNDVTKGHDFLLFRINGNPIADGKVGAPFPIYSGPILDNVITNVGYGVTGNGITGFVNGTQGTRRAGNMVPRAYFVEGSTDITSSTLTRTSATTIMFADFINPATNVSPLLTIINGVTTTAASQELEYMITPFDSGSPALINDNGVWKIAGVGSFIVDPYDFNGPAFGIYGEVSAFSSIDEQTAVWIYNMTVPEPSTMAFIALIVCGGAGAGWVRYRQQRRQQEQIITGN